MSEKYVRRVLQKEKNNKVIIQVNIDDEKIERVARRKAALDNTDPSKMESTARKIGDGLATQAVTDALRGTVAFDPDIETDVIIKSEHNYTVQ